MNIRPTTNLLQPLFLLIVATLSLLAFAPGSVLSHRLDNRAAVGPTLLWDDVESHRWVGEPWGDDASVEWVDFDGRQVLKTVIVAEGFNWSLIRTDAFPAADWGPVTSISVDVYQTGAPSSVGIKLEVRGTDFDTIIETPYCFNITPESWRTCTWTLNQSLDYSEVAHLSLVFDRLDGTSPTFYLDNLRLVTTSGADLWDDFDDGSRNWFYFGNWFDWNSARIFGLDPVSHNETAPDSPAGALFLQWDYQNGQSPGLSTAEIGTSELGDVTDWSIYYRLQADVHISNAAAPISLFFWDADASVGFGSETRTVAAADTWQSVIWNIPWPAGFDATSVDELKFVVNGIDSHQTGTLHIDNIELVSKDSLEPATGRKRHFDMLDDQDPFQNDFNAPKGELISPYITTTFMTDIVVGGEGAALQLSYDLPPDAFTGIWQSLFGPVDNLDRALDFTKEYEQIHFWVRGSGQSSARHNLKVELKDITGQFDRTAYRYVTIDDNDTTWRKVILDADVTNGEFWSYNGQPPDPTQMKELVFVLESAFNNPTGTFFLDNIHFIVRDPAPVDGLFYEFETFNVESFYNDFQGNCGDLNDQYVATAYNDGSFIGSWGHSLQIDHNLENETFAGYWCSLWGHIDNEKQSLDFTDIYGGLNGADKGFEQIRFWVRGSGASTGNHVVKVELKDVSGAFDRTAYRYVYVDDSDTNWREVVLDADVTNAAFWSYKDQPPAPTQMKELVFVLESDLNAEGGTFYIDDIRFVDGDDQPVNIDKLSDDAFLDLVSEKTFLTFLDWRNPDTGLFQDRSVFFDVYSTAATGFGLTALTIGESRGWIDRVKAMAMAEQALQTLWDGQTPNSAATNGHQGYFYHFLDEDGYRKDESELSSVDTAILLFGILTVREYFADNAKIVKLADDIYDRVQWGWMLNDEDLFYLGWKPECNDTDYQIDAPGGGCFSSFPDGGPNDWDIYTDEVIMINVLAVGSATHPMPKSVFYAWWRNWEEYMGISAVESWPGSFFTYVFAHLWIDFATLGQDAHLDPSLRVNWWENSVQAADANYKFARDHEEDTLCDGDDHFTTYNYPVFGATAAEGPTGYLAFGFEPAALDPPEHDGTIAPYGAGSAIMFIPDKSISALRHFFKETDLWRYRFGLGDAYNLDPPDCGQPWYSHATFGIDNGPLLLAIENHRSRLVWETFMHNRQVQEALEAIWNLERVHLPVVFR